MRTPSDPMPRPGARASARLVRPAAPKAGPREEPAPAQVRGPEPAAAPEAPCPAPADPRGVEMILRAVESLPTLPAIATRLLRITSAEDADLKEIVRLIQTDPAMTARVLSLCSRAGRVTGRAITTVAHAVVMVGLDALKSAVLSVQVIDLARRAGGGDGAGDGGGRFEARGFWRHSVAVACAAEGIARAHPRLGVRPDEAFVGGLLHDLGKLALHIALPRAYDRVLELAEARRCEVASCERAVLGLDHHAAGRRLARRWNLPRSFEDAMWLHNTPPGAVPTGADRGMIAVVSAADALARRLMLGWSGNAAAPMEIETIAAEAGLDQGRLDRGEAGAPGLIGQLPAMVAQRCADLGVDESSSDAMLLEGLQQANERLARLSGSLTEKAAAARRQRAALEELTRFAHGCAERPGEGESGACLVIRSAARALGEGSAAIVHRDGPGAPWLLAELEGGADGRITECALGDNVAGAAAEEEVDLQGAAALAAARRGTRHPAGPARAVVIRDGADGGPAACLLVGQDAPASNSAPPMEPLIAAWGAQMVVSAERDSSQRLAEDLAGAMRDLAGAQAALSEARVMARLGVLTAGAAHEMNTPLAVLSGRAQLLLRTLEGGAERAAAEEMVRAANRLSDLIARLNLIASPPEPKLGPVSIADLLASVVREARGAARPEGARSAIPMIRVSIPGPIAAARLDRELFSRALFEVLVNALESGPRTGVEILVQTGPPDDRLNIVISDDGAGMGQRALEHAMDPFFSDKPAGRKAGLGLATARRIIGLHGGALTLRSEAGRGTTATVTVPDWRWSEARALAEAA